MRHLSLNCGLGMNDPRHPQLIMKELGITYRYGIPQSISDEWWFLDCHNVPDTLPPFITDMKGFKPREYIGWGLSKEMADSLE